MNLLTRSALPAVLLAVAAGTNAADFDAGTYHDSNCLRCHGTGVYTRPDRRITSYPKLQAQVARCDSMLETKLFPDDLQRLVDLLNTRYYKFEQ